MLPPYLRKELGGGAGTSGSYIVIPLADAFRGLFEILALPFQIGGQRFIKRSGRILPMPLGVLLQLRFALGLEWDSVQVWIHRALRLGARNGSVKHRVRFSG